MALSSNPCLASTTSNLLVVGDSLSAAHGMNPDKGWVELLAKRLKQKNYPYQVINISTSGDTTTHGVEKLPTALEQYKPKVIILALSANDGLRGLQAPLIEQNLNTLVTLSQKSGAKVLLVEMLIPLNYGPVYRAQLSAVYHTITQRHHLIHVPFLLRDVALNPALMQADGLHPTAEAQPLILDNVWPYLQKLLK